MKYVRALTILSVVFGAASGAWAQNGLSGAPELLRFGQDDPAAYVAATSTAPGPYESAYTNRRASGPALAPATGAALPAAPIPGSSQPPAGPTPSVMDQMLDETGCWGAPAYAAPGYGCGAGQPCGDVCGPCFQPQWYVSAAGLFMTRDKANCLWTTYETDNNPNQLMRFNDAKPDWRGGFEVKLGHRFGECGQWAIEADYWRIDGLNGYASMALPGWTVSTPLIVSDIEFAGVNGTVYFDGAAVHRIWRHNDFENVEINLIRAPVFPDGGPIDVSWLVGVRYFRFDESLIFGSETLSADYAYLSDRIYNNMIGAQVGLDVGYRLGYNWRAFGGAKLGLYDNHIENTFDAYNGDGVHANPTAASGMTGQFPVVAKKDQFAVLAQIDAGLEWRFHPQWRAFGGYRLMAATGVGLADHQFLTYVVDLPEYGRIKSNGNLLLHGAFAGVEFRF